MATILSEKNNFQDAIILLSKYYNNHPDDLNSAQLLAYCFQKNGQYEKAQNIYEVSVSNYAKAEFLQLDYARMMIERKNFEKANDILLLYLNRNPQSVEAMTKLGYIRYWEGKYRESLNYFREVLVQYPQNRESKNMIDAIETIISPKIKINLDYGSDSQPLKSTFTNIGTAWYKSHLFIPSIYFSYMNFSDSSGNNQIPLFQVTNQFDILRNKLHIIASLGIAEKTDKSGSQFLERLEITQNLTRNLNLFVKVENQPYYYSLASIQLPVSYYSLSAKINWSSAKGFNAESAIDQFYFMDNNQISNIYAWVLSPDFGNKSIKFNIGYSYSLSDSKENSFESIETLDEILKDFNFEPVEGIYQPYFTPENQNIHGLIGVISIFSEKRLSVTLKGNIGVYAYADIPYLYLDLDENSDIFINMGFSKQTKTTLDLRAKINYSINRKISIEGSYIYSDNFFYTNNLMNFSLKYLFL